MRRFILFLIIILIAHIGVSQKNADVGFMVGSSTYIGDLNTETPFRDFRLGIKAIYRYNFHSRIALRAEIAYAQIASNDKKSIFQYQLIRDNQFHSDILQIAALFEINFVRFELNPRKQYVSPYIVGGIGGMLLNYEFGREVKDYVNMPFGMGLKISLNDRFIVGVEYTINKTFRDDLDKIDEWLYTSAKNYPLKQRANVQNDDWFTFFGAFLSFKLKDCVTCPANL